ncbi:L-aspartate oxidase [Paramicrobacterium fandaimingii]|uniref:L-aspartate oxidase n=1 Tax=Paramicrobacterium fandaimingii TaxID=2708079 RepID=UPI00141F9F41|nr:L-aspartate oxidase [Microbacterium fandaimingii]
MSRVIIVGSGIAGLTAALRSADEHDVTIITKDALGDGNTARAQGGIAGVLFDDDSIESHIADTLAVGAGLCDEDAVRVLCTEGPQRIRDLSAAGVDFDSEAGSYAKGREAAHSYPRVVHAGGDATGRAIARTLAQRVRERRILVLENTVLIDLVTELDSVIGVDVLTPHGPIRMLADTTIIATGGSGQLYARTTNPAAATGDGVAAALRAGADIADAEFYQFHPTALVDSGFLVSEAVRGAGAVLLDDNGRRFMLDIDPRGELAPRNVVALALARTMSAQNGRPVMLDATGVPRLRERFPTITAAVMHTGVDWTHEPVAVTPAAHYWMGGIATDQIGRTSIDGLVAIGEAARTGVHGGNRLASNSLLEGAVFAQRAAAALSRGSDLGHPSDSPIDTHLTAPTVDRGELQRLAWSALGVERSEQQLTSAIEHFDEWDSASAPTPASRTAIENRNLLLIARVIARQALARRESRGAHTRIDYPRADPTQAHSARATAPAAEALVC